MKTIIIAFAAFNGYVPIPIIFETYEACCKVELSFKRLADAAGSPTPRQIYLHGHRGTPYFLSCRKLDQG